VSFLPLLIPPATWNTSCFLLTVIMISCIDVSRAMSYSMLTIPPTPLNDAHQGGYSFLGPMLGTSQRRHAVSNPAETYQQQLNRLKSRGLIVPNESFALHILEHHNSFRFPFTPPADPDQFLPGTTFDQLWNLYHLTVDSGNRSWRGASGSRFPCVLAGLTSSDTSSARWPIWIISTLLML
jgi:hypothetical protein